MLSEPTAETEPVSTQTVDPALGQWLGAIENGSARQYVQETLAAAEHRWRAALQLATANRELARSLELSDFLAAVCRSARALTGADGATFVLRDGDEVQYAAEDAVGPLWAGQRFPITCCISGWAILHDTAAVVEDIFTDSRIPVAAYQSTFVKSLAMVPVRRGDALAESGFPDPLAAMGVYWAVRHRATAEELAVLQALADMASVALVNTRLYEQMRQARNEAEASSHAKDEFLAMLGHELRNPLAAIRNALTVARLSPPRCEEALQIAERQLRHLGCLVDDLLDVARVTRGQIQLRMQRIDLAGVVQQAIEATRLLCEQRRHTVCVTLPRAPVSLEADPTRLAQILGNLLTNAAQYTAPGGRIEVTAEDEGDQVVLRVRDSGAGISPEVLPHVFDMFAQGPRSLDRKEGGLGMGLTLVRALVELHGGRVEAHSAGLGLGSEFVVRLPRVSAADSAASGSPAC